MNFDPDLCIEQSIADLHHVADGVHPHWHLSGLIDRLRHAPETMAISTNQFCRFESGIFHVRDAIPDIFHCPRDWERAEAGLWALFGMSRCWRAPAPFRDEDWRRRLRSLKGQAQILQLLAHMMSLEDQFAERQAIRRQIHVETLKLPPARAGRVAA